MTREKLRRKFQCQESANIIPILNGKTGPALLSDDALDRFHSAAKINPYIDGENVEIIVATTRAAMLRFVRRHRKITNDRLLRW